MKTKILFIVNPISGGKKKDNLPGIIQSNLDLNKFDYRISYTERVEHANMLAKAAIKENYKIIVAVGGDGTVNEIARAIVDTDIHLSILPFGSGNGLARMLKIPMDTGAALKIINHHKSIKIDSAVLNGKAFFNIAGTGFDAQISNAFANNKKRGLLGYIKSTIQEIKNYESEEYTIELDELKLKKRAFIISLANSTQYGNNAHIAPNADLQDGILDVVIVKPFSFFLLPFLAWRMFANSVDKSRYVEMYQSSKIKIIRNTSAPIHLDGEPCMDSEILNIEVKPLSLNVIVKSDEQEK